MARQTQADGMQHVGTFILSYEELQGAFQQAAAALQTMSTCLSQLQAPQPSRQQALPAVLTSLHHKVPSHKLERYLQQQASAAAAAGPPDSTAPTRLHDAHAALTTSLDAAAQALEQLQAACSAYAQQQVLTQPLPLAPVAAAADPSADGASGEDQKQHHQAHHQAQQQPEMEQEVQEQLTLQEPPQGQEQQRKQQHHTDSVTVEEGSGLMPHLVTPDGANSHGSGSSSAAGRLQQAAGVYLMMQSLAAGAAKEVEWMAAAAGTVSLTTPPNEVDTYAEMAGLLPFTDDQLAEALAQLVLEGTSV